MAALDTMEARWARLRPHVRVHGPKHGKRPTVLMFHGCGGVRPQLHGYAEAAAALGWRSVVVDSYAPRGWSRAYALAFVCTGLVFRGEERTGDLLAAVWGAVEDLDADPDHIVLAGWSHGSWSIMDLMTMPLDSPGEAGLADPSSAPLEGVKGLVLAYPYGGVGALTRTRRWVRTPPALAMLAERDHVTSVRDAERLYEAVQASGADIDIWRVDATHAFDEPGDPIWPVSYHSPLAAEALDRFGRFLADRGPRA